MFSQNSMNNEKQSDSFTLKNAFKILKKDSQIQWNMFVIHRHSTVI